MPSLLWSLLAPAPMRHLSLSDKPCLRLCVTVCARAHARSWQLRACMLHARAHLCAYLVNGERGGCASCFFVGQAPPGGLGATRCVLGGSVSGLGPTRAGQVTEIRRTPGRRRRYHFISMLHSSVAMTLDLLRAPLSISNSPA